MIIKKDAFLEDDRFVESQFSFRPKRKKGKGKKGKKKKAKQLATASSTNTLIGEENESAKAKKQILPKKEEVSTAVAVCSVCCAFDKCYLLQANFYSSNYEKNITVYKKIKK